MPTYTVQFASGKRNGGNPIEAETLHDAARMAVERFRGAGAVVHSWSVNYGCMSGSESANIYLLSEDDESGIRTSLFLVTEKKK